MRTFAVTCKFHLLYVVASCLLCVLSGLCARTDWKTTIQGLADGGEINGGELIAHVPALQDFFVCFCIFVVCNGVWTAACQFKVA